MRQMANPVLLRVLLASVLTVGMVLLGLVLLWRVRRKMREEGVIDEPATGQRDFDLSTYSAVIQSLKQEKHQLQTQGESDRKRAEVTARMNATVMQHLPCGVLFFNLRGLVRQANPAAKKLLGFASPLGLHASQIFRGAMTRAAEDAASPDPVEALRQTLQNQGQTERLEVEYTTPSTERRRLSLVLVPVRGMREELLGAACICTDIGFREQRNELAAAASVPSIS